MMSVTVVQPFKMDDSVTDEPGKQPKASYLNGLHLISVLILCVLPCFPLILVPQNDDIKFWQNWSSMSSIAGDAANYFFGFSLIRTIHQMFESKLFFKLKSVMTFKVFVQLYVAKLIGYLILPKLTAYLIWNVGFGNDNVMPFNAYLGLIGFPIPYLALWMIFQQQLRYNNRGRRKFQAYIYFKFWRNFTFILFLVSNIIVRLLPSEFQWVMAILLPINREMDYMISTKILSNGPGLLDDGIKTALVVTVNSNYALHLAITIGTKATTFTSCCILAVDFFSNLKSAYKIFRLANRTEPDHLEDQKRLLEKEDELKSLSLIEAIEILIPISYIITFLIAYYGPNAEVFGGIRNSYWHYKAIEDVKTLSSTVLWMGFVDFSSALFGGLLLSTCSINLLQEGCRVMKTYWHIIALTIACELYLVSMEVAMSRNGTKIILIYSK